MSSFQLMDPIPTGAWCAYYHAPENTKWTSDSYEKIGTARTWADVFNIMNTLEHVSIQQGMIFWMREDVPPLYENHANIKGGCYSIRVNRSQAVRFYELYTIATMLGKAVEDSSNIIQGVTISPKRIIEKNQNFNVIKIWNKDCTKFNRTDELCRLENINQCSEIIYTPHIQKKL